MPARASLRPGSQPGGFISHPQSVEPSRNKEPRQGGAEYLTGSMEGNESDESARTPFHRHRRPLSVGRVAAERASEIHYLLSSDRPS
jgi:hypothetical protein